MSRPPHRLSVAQVDELCQSYEAGATVRSCAARFGVHEQTVRKHLSRRGIPRRVNGRRLSAADEQLVQRRHLAGESGAAIARSLGVSPDTIHRALRRG